MPSPFKQASCLVFGHCENLIFIKFVIVQDKLMEDPINCEVIIIGAGAAGVAAAREFQQKKISYLILEA